MAKLALCGFSVFLTACVADSPSAPVDDHINTQAVLDWNLATITLPLDQYGMTPREAKISDAAASILFAQCVTGDLQVSSDVIVEARRTLEVEPDYNRWLYGIWNAEFIAEHGRFSNEIPAPIYIDASPAIADKCRSSEEYLSIEPITAMRSPQSGVGSMIMEWSWESTARTTADSRVILLVEELNTCIQNRGYSVWSKEESSLGGVKIDNSWSEESIRRAELVEANCNDSINLTKKAADIEAEYQIETIFENEAELLEIKKQANERVAKAEQILTDAGVL